MNPFVVYLIGLLAGTIGLYFYFVMVRPCPIEGDHFWDTVTSKHNLQFFISCAIILWAAMVFTITLMGNLHTYAISLQFIGILIYFVILFVTIISYVLYTEHNSSIVMPCTTPNDSTLDTLKTSAFYSGVLGSVGLLVFIIMNHMVSGPQQMQVKAAINNYYKKNPSAPSSAFQFDNYSTYLPDFDAPV